MSDQPRRQPPLVGVASGGPKSLNRHPPNRLAAGVAYPVRLEQADEGLRVVLRKVAEDYLAISALALVSTGSSRIASSHSVSRDPASRWRQTRHGRRRRGQQLHVQAVLCR